MSLPKLKAHGINAASITYDAGDVLSAFSRTYKIEFPMLSDVGSKVIRDFGIFNTNIPPDHKMLYGIPWPGDYLVAPDGTVRDKLFLPSYEHRVSASEVIFRNCGVDDGNSVEIKTNVLEATITLSTDHCFPGQELGSALDIRLKPGWHIYGKPLPGNYRATELLFDDALVGEQELELPVAKPMLLKALGETLPVYDGRVQAVGKLGIKWSPPMPAPFLLPLGKTIEPGLHKIGGTLRFQVCSDSICEAPEEIRFELPLTVEKGVPPAPKPG
jgi:AhpC/TSA family/Disulphide bond corrector protein DsbC